MRLRANAQALKLQAGHGTGIALPLYDYRCEKGHTVEVLLRSGERGPSVCPTCGGKTTRMMGAPAAPKVRGGRRRRDIRFRKKGTKINLRREGGS